MAPTRQRSAGSAHPDLAASIAPEAVRSGLDALRRRAGAALFEQVAGPHGPADRERFRTAPGPRWFADDRPIRRVHGDAAMFVGGLRALLLQSLHPLAMAAVDAHSGYRGDPWGRLHRTSTFLAATTFGAASDAQRAVDRVRTVHDRVRGIAPDGRPYQASDPHLLEWVHVAEVDSFLRCHQRYGEHPLTDSECDDYVADTARVAAALGVIDPPRSRGSLEERLTAFRPELHGTPEARRTARFLLLNPPLPWTARAPYTALAAAAVALLPVWTRAPLRLPWLPLTEATTIPLAGQGLVRMIRWVMTAPPDPLHTAQ